MKIFYLALTMIVLLFSSAMGGVRQSVAAPFKVRHMRNLKVAATTYCIQVLRERKAPMGWSDDGAEKAIKKIFPSPQIITAEAQTFEEQKVKVYRISAEGKVVGWAVILDEMGKVKPITFLVGIDTQGAVAGVSILEYRDMFGSGIKRRSFLRQFQGKSAEDKISIGTDIDAVTSATISSQAAASAVRKAILIISEFQKAAEVRKPE